MAPSAPATAWAISSGCATCLLAGPPSRIDLDRPTAGIQLWRQGSEPQRLLGLNVEAACVRRDAWCRGGDVTAVYEPVGGAPLRATAMWRATPSWCDATFAPDVWRRELVVSAQTPLLEATPRIAVTADVAGRNATPLTVRPGGLAAPGPDEPPHGFLVPGPGDSLLLFLVHPTDARSIDLQTHGDRVRLEARLFPEAVEKGVLLRSRVIAAIGTAGGPTIPSWADALASDFVASEPVLTT